MKTLVVTDEAARLDRFLNQIETGFSRAVWQRAIASGDVQVNDQAAKASQKLKAGDVVAYRLPLAPSSEVVPEPLPLDIVYEDEWLLAINKPRGMVVHPAPGHRRGTLVNALIARYGEALSKLGGEARPGIVHRIDKDTSGLILAVKDDAVHRKMAGLLKKHEIARVYDALSYGHPETKEGTIDAPIGRDPKNRQKMAIVADGKKAISRFTVVQTFARGSHLKVELQTGRTHQIRVHLAYIGVPVVGDPVYARGRPAYGMVGQALHAGILRFTHPMTAEAIELSVPPPDDFLACMAALDS